MDRLRSALGAFDLKTELDPMKAQETKSLIKLSTSGPDYAGISHLLNDRFVAEPKYDGVRLKVCIGLTGSSVVSGRRSVVTYAYKNRTGNYPHLAQICGENLNGVILDGELIAPTPNMQVGKTLTSSILTASCSLNNSSPALAVAAQKKYGNAEFWVFDIVGVAGDSLIQDMPYDQRRAHLEIIVPAIQKQFPDCNIKLVPQMPATEETIRQAMLNGFEGVVLKERNSPYLPGKRKGWWKVKTFSTADAFIWDWLPGKDRNEGLVGSLELAVVMKEVISPEEYAQLTALPQPNVRFGLVSSDGKAWLCRKVAQVGNLTDAFREEISDEHGAMKKEWRCRVIEFVGQGVTDEIRVRHPHMIRLRPDKTWRDCEIDQLGIFPKV